MTRSTFESEQLSVSPKQRTTRVRGQHDTGQGEGSFQILQIMQSSMTSARATASRTREVMRQKKSYRQRGKSYRQSYMTQKKKIDGCEIGNL